ncbi:MAG: hypothetical protein RIQ83_940 [Pseudomonadota bacterium]|jgi:hypothetical protein
MLFASATTQIRTMQQVDMAGRQRVEIYKPDARLVPHFYIAEYFRIATKQLELEVIGI